MTDDEKTCPHCAETIKHAAEVCRYCGRDMPGADDPTQQVKARSGVMDGVKIGFGMFVVLPVLITVLVIVGIFSSGLFAGFWSYWQRKPAQSSAEPATQAPMAAGITEGTAGIEWVTIPGGTFTMGSADSKLWSRSRPTHQVTLKTFQMSKTLVTNAQYRACVAAEVCRPVDYSNHPSFEADAQPVVLVDWDQAKIFSEWAGGRLPSEAEWEYAARSAGRDQKYPWGDSEATCERTVISEGGYGCGKASLIWPVCSKPAGNTQQGLCDMAGNAWEWVEDWFHDSYKGAPTDGSAWEDAGTLRGKRGGSWGDDARTVRSANRSSGDPWDKITDLGFRPAR